MYPFRSMVRSHSVESSLTQYYYESNNKLTNKTNKSFNENQKYLPKIRTAFNNASQKTREYLTKEEWCSSDIRRLFKEEKINDSSFEEYFDKIDSDMDGLISWSELVQFLMKDLSARRNRKADISRFIKCVEPSLADKNNYHREQIISIGASYGTKEYFSVSNDSIRFWSMETLSQTRCFMVPGNFQCAIVFEQYNVLAVATISRKIIFFKLDNNSLLDVEMAGSITKNALKNLSVEETGEQLKNINKNDTPLFNTPICMVQSYVNQVNPIFFVADSEGFVEAFKLITPIVKFSNHYDIEYLGKHRYHEQNITCIKSIHSLECYGTSSFDGKVVLWTFSETRGFSEPLRVFNERSMITSFSYISNPNSIVTCVSGKKPSVWTIVDGKKNKTLVGGLSSIILASEFLITSGKTHILTMTNDKEFILFDAVNYEQIATWKDSVEERKFSTCFYDEKKRLYLTGDKKIIAWKEDYESNKGIMNKTSNFPIIRTFYSSEFNEIITIDMKRNVYIFHIENGKKGMLEIERDPNNFDVIGSCLSSSTRVMLINNDKGNLSKWNYNLGNVLSESTIPSPKDGPIIMEIFNISSNEYIVRTGWDRNIYIYSSVNDIYTLKYQKIGHAFNVTAICATPSGLVSGSSGGELIFWLLETDTLVAKTFICCKNKVENIIYRNNKVFVSDNGGCISIYQLPKLELIACFRAHNELEITTSITSMIMKGDILITGDSLGYLKEWKVNEKDELIPGKLIRCHDNKIESILVICNGKFFVTTGNDEIVRMWERETKKYVGAFNNEETWDINKEDTWKLQSPVAKDLKHFEKSKSELNFTPKLRSKSNIIFTHNNGYLAPLQLEKEESSINEGSLYQYGLKSFSVEAFTKKFEDFMVKENSKESLFNDMQYSGEKEFVIKKKKNLIPLSSPEEIQARIFKPKEPNKHQKITRLDGIRKSIIKPTLPIPKLPKKMF